MDENSRLRVSGPNVVHQTINGETIVLDLEKGHYYSLLKSSVMIWEGVEKGMTLGEIVDLLHTRFEAATDRLRAVVETMVRQLVDEGLVVMSSGPGPASGAATSGQEWTHSGDGHPKKEVFEDPIFQKFTDMKELLLLDPIHEVDVAGWPNARSVDVGNKTSDH